MVSQKLFAAFAALSFVAGSEAALCRPKSSTSVDVASSSTVETSSVVTVSTESTTAATTTTESASSTVETSSTIVTISTDSTTVPTSTTESAPSTTESSSTVTTVSTDSTTLATSITQAASSTTSSAEPVITNILINGDFNDARTIKPWTSGLNGGIDGLGLDPDTQVQGWSLSLSTFGPMTSYYVFNTLDASRIVPGAEYDLSAYVNLDLNFGGGLGCQSVDIYCVWGGLNQAEGHTSATTTDGSFQVMTTTCRWSEEQAGDNPKILFKFECGNSYSHIDEVTLVGPLAQ
ncbi:hypothetical protein NW754_011543 [Fusarium falciforme]|uniref:CBM-cenC domain-containing protein n=1 Tax=Fusarium falciforme TaxID=195108 RepID=A0A9W8R871_9HYPO|nr:hypothetical protein NW754_011543 [Fusarium falciforme]KAJ4188042.1 hypothetical protein NW755_006837 [Fusarium falciforme]KAJ4251708.1 hypothetical protein NW757_006543 [Fusarium falciforme]